ncbi:hypothetical protein [Streptacidiphilus rugosus]|uniref:hypothetical protein n=1 Tax=Streptacidiphilus rugosus TaxID=405783 RepID=UPI000568E40D|nr:hypothetical protein [Streptacidiphilus rugosus]
MALLKLAAVLLACGGSLVPAAASSTSSTSGAPAPVLLDCVGHPQNRPTQYVVACGDGNNYLVALHWTQWNGTAARASGTDAANDCRPYCAAGHFHRYPVEVTLDGPVSWAGHDGTVRYTRLTLDYPGDRPAGMPAHFVFPLPKGPAGATPV